MKQIFSGLVLFIIILNSGCGKNVFFYTTTRRSANLSPAPLAPPIASKPLSFSNNYSSIVTPLLFPEYMRDIHQVFDIKPPSMTHASYVNTANINVSNALDLRSDLDLSLSKNINIPDMTHVSYLNTANMNTTDVANLRSDSNLVLSKNIKAPSMFYVPYTNPIHINSSNIVDLKSDQNPLLFENREKTTMIRTPSYMDSVHVNTPNIIELESYPTILPKNVKIPDTIRSFYIDPVHISASDIVELESDISSISSKNIEISNITHKPYANSISVSVSDVAYLKPSPDISLTDNVEVQKIPFAYTSPIERDVQPEVEIIKPPSLKIIEKKSQHEFHDIFTYTLSEDSFFQSTYNKNKTTLLFRAFDNYDLNIRDLQEDDIIVLENQTEVKNYTLSSERQRLDRKLEVVFAIDTAASMRKYANDAKENIVYFVNKLQEAQIHASFCLVTFKDLVEREGDECFPDDVPTSRIDENNSKFLEDISELGFRRGGVYQENALGGVVSASKAPWSVDSQRMVILVTDALFWERRDSHPEARKAPEYSTVLDVLAENDIQVFALTQDYPGFSKNYFELPSLVEATSGRWFNIKNLSNQDMNNIFDQVRDQIDVSYKIDYFVEDQERLDPFLSLEDRQIVLTARNPQVNAVKIQIEDVHSNMPEGSRQLQSYWPLSREAVVNEDHVFVTVDEQSESHFLIENGGIFFPDPPPIGSKIFIQYEAGSLKENVREHPLLLQIDPQHQSSSDIQIASASLELNGMPVPDQDFEIKYLGSTDSMQLHLSENIFDNADLYGIRSLGELRISLSYEVVSRHESIN